ncbi:enoyl-CoA hydratase/isomerase family protein [Chelatococcus reniformis]|uniref:Enoyl-CoA hydratase n=1 Tax=Chelatococcus reniformis TaxID=1494448 RepID=A0A916UJ59_9HYPH|nr:enoyl-CoA hydratase-related protein [Chelatococcus reniformis]GGC74869.1 enoyl-CoA hydratase [Chelatococcus reniformis]
MAADPVLLTVDDGLAHIRLNRPDASNGMNIALLKALYDAIMTCHGDPEVRAVLLTGEGPNFCAGGDVKDFASKGEALPDYLRQTCTYLQISVGALLHLQPPVVVAVHGFAAGGGGFGLVCAADLVIAGQSAKFLAGATRVGMAPDAGVSVTLPRLVGFRKAAEIILTNPVLSAEEAKALGLVNRIVPDEEVVDAGLALARELAAGAPRALAAAKRLLWNGIGLSVDTCLPEEARTVAELSGTADAREGLAAVIERRKPTFVGR